MYSQETILPLETKLISALEQSSNVRYFKDVNGVLGKYTGAWEVNSGIHYLKLVITKLNHEAIGHPSAYNNPDFEDDLLVKMVYKQSGVLIYDTVLNTSEDALIGGNNIVSENKILLVYNEPTNSCRRLKQASLELEFIPTGTSGLGGVTGDLSWNRINSLSYESPNANCIDGSNIDTSSFKIPANLILQKQ
jgi:hypothetical protein